jgi:anti-sigma B factor antagonist
MNVVESAMSEDVLVVAFIQTTLRDTPVISAAKEQLEKQRGEAKTERKMLLSFRNVKFMSSEMIGVIVTLFKKCKEDKIDLKLSNVSADIMQVFKITNLHKLLQIYDDESKAMAAFQGKKAGWFW